MKQTIRPIYSMKFRLFIHFKYQNAASSQEHEPVEILKQAEIYNV